MKLGTLFTLSAVAGFAFGIGLLAFPGTLIGLLSGQTPDALGTHIAREAGTLVLAVGIISWMARRAEPSLGTNAIVAGLAVAYPILAIVAIASILAGLLAPTYWVNVILFVLFGLGFWIVGKPSFGT